MEWDDNNDGKISWLEALDEFGKIFRSFMKDNRDHWVLSLSLPPLLGSPSSPLCRRLVWLIKHHRNIFGII
jgi:hypothetical protein